MKYVKLFKDSLEVINTLTDEQSGQLFKAIIDYSEDREPNLNGLLSAVFFQFKQQIDRAKSDYSDVCERNKANGLKHKRVGSSGSQNKPEQARTRQDKDKDKEEYISTVADIVSFLNIKTNKNFKTSTASTNRFIIARLNDGFILDDFKRVIEVKSSQWLNTSNEKYIRPETLFGNKFDSYLNEISTSSNNQHFDSSGKAIVGNFQ